MLGCTSVKAAAKAERRGADEHRRRLLDGLRGTVVEIGAGHGLNLLCSVPNQDRALAEARRVLRPGGELRFYEHVIPNCQPKRALLGLVDHSGLWPRIAGGCHPARDTTSAIQRAGFDIQSIDRIMFAASALEPSIPHILGVARRP